MADLDREHFAVDEDNLNHREAVSNSAKPEGDSPSKTGVTETPVSNSAKKRRGHPKGTPRVPGSGRKRSAGSDRVLRLLAGDASKAKEDADAIFRVRAPEIAAKLVSRALGEAEWVTGPTGKKDLQYPKQASQDRALEIVCDKLWPTLKASDVTSTSHVTTATVQPTEAELRKALYDHMGVHAPQQAAPVDGGDNITSSHDTSSDASDDIRRMSTYSDTVPDRDNVIISEPAPTIAAGDNPDRIEFPEGYFAVRGKNSTGAECWLCYGPGSKHERDYAAIKQSREACVHWFNNNTSAGLALNKGLRIVK